MKKRVISFLIFVSVLVSTFPVSVQTHAGEETMKENKYGYVDSDIKVYEQPSKLYKASYNLPSRFDLREEGGVTPIRDQGNYSTCWAFASMGTVESNIKYTTGKEMDFSEIDLAIDRCGIAGIDGGGNFAMSSTYFGNGSGPVLEADNPYPNSGQTLVDINAPATYNVDNILYLPSRKDSLDNVKIKEAIKDIGGVGISYFNDNSYLADDGVSYYYNNGKDSNHSVTVIGWDDNYPKEKFKNTPAGNGAFIARNSWGTYFGEDGYF